MRTPGTSGDLPDWVCETNAGTLLIAEAKGSHNGAGYDPALSSAMKQVKRVQVVSGKLIPGKKPIALKVKQYSIATRWAVKGDSKLSKPWLAVHDPNDGDREPTPSEREQLAKRVSVMHFSSLLMGMGYVHRSYVVTVYAACLTWPFCMSQASARLRGEGRQAQCGICICVPQSTTGFSVFFPYGATAHKNQLLSI